MCINQSLVIMLRAIIDDLDSVTYTDSRLEQLLAVAAMYVNKDLDTTYVINIGSPDITPDPFDSSDTAFINLVVIKAACTIDQSAFRVRAATSGLEARCGPAVMKVLEGSSTYKDLINLGACGTYLNLLRDYKLGTGEACHAILSPFVSDNFDPQDLRYGGSYRGNIE